MTLSFNFQDTKELYRYLNKISYAIYGVDYNSITFLNGNVYDFKPNNILINAN